MKFGKECLCSARGQLKFGLGDVLVDGLGKLNEIGKVLLKFELIVAIVRDADFVDVGTNLWHETHRSREFFVPLAHSIKKKKLLFELEKLNWQCMGSECLELIATNGSEGDFFL